MSKKPIEKFQDRFTEILERPEPMRTQGLNVLLDDLDLFYEIPFKTDKEFERNHVAVMTLYRAVSKARNYEGVGE